MIGETKPRWVLALLAVLVALALITAACGDSSDDGGGNGGDPNSEADGGDGGSDENSGDEGGGDGGGDADSENGDGDNGGDGDGDGEGEDQGKDAPGFGDVSSGWEDVEAKVTYELTTVGEDGESTSTVTHYNQSPNVRTDLEEDGVMTTFIRREEASYICIQEQCVSYGADALNPIPFFSNFASPEGLKLYANVEGIEPESGKEEIAGFSATCYSLDQNGVETGWCFGDDGILLRTFSSADGSEFEMLAVEVSDDVSASDFEPPYEVVELPDIGDISQ